MTVSKLRSYTVKELGELAKKKGVAGWHSMRKEQLVQALSGLARGKAESNGSGKTRRSSPTATKSKSRGAASTRSSATKSSSSRAKPARKNSTPKTTASKSKSSGNGRPVSAKQSAKVQRKLKQVRAKVDRAKDLAFKTRGDRDGGPTEDRLVVMVRDPYWLHAWWELTHRGIERAKAALGQEWHGAKPVLRLMDCSTQTATTSTATTVLRHIEIHGGVNNWYVDVDEPPCKYRMEIGYLTLTGRFFALARSNFVTTPEPGSSDSLDENWTDVAENFERIYALSGGNDPDGPSVELQELFEERLRRPMNSPLTPDMAALSNGVRRRSFDFTVDAEMIVYGKTEPDARVTLKGEPVPLRPDGTFTVRYTLPNCRQVIPAVACSSDGIEQRTVVLAIERNTKTMEPVIRDHTM